MRDEIWKLTERVADLSLDTTILQESLRTKWCSRRSDGHGWRGSRRRISSPNGGACRAI